MKGKVLEFKIYDKIAIITIEDSQSGMIEEIPCLGVPTLKALKEFFGEDYIGKDIIWYLDSRGTLLYNIGKPKEESEE